MDRSIKLLSISMTFWGLNLVCLTVAPGPPAKPTISNISKDSCTLSWQPPSNDGGSRITGYHVERRSAVSKRWVFISKAPISGLDMKVKDLFEDTEYEFRVSAENKVGTGSPSQPSTPFVSKDPWGKSMQRWGMSFYNQSWKRIKTKIKF